MARKEKPIIVPGVTDEDPNTGRRIRKKKSKVPAAVKAAAAAVAKRAKRRK